jgi:hypothetical protein
LWQAITRSRSLGGNSLRATSTGNNNEVGFHLCSSLQDANGGRLWAREGGNRIISNRQKATSFVKEGVGDPLDHAPASSDNASVEFSRREEDARLVENWVDQPSRHPHRSKRGG